MSDHSTVAAGDQVGEVDIDKTSKAGWEWFTRFLLINVILCIVGLLLVGALTVWS